MKNPSSGHSHQPSADEIQAASALKPDLTGGTLTPGRELQGVWNAIPNLARYDSAGLLMQHLKRVGANIRSAPFTFLVTVLTTALALLLLAFGIALMANLSNAVTHAQASLEMSIYLNDDVPTSTVQSMTENLRRDPDVESVQFRDKAEALALFRTHLGNDATLLEGLDTANPLPASLEVRLLGGRDSVAAFERISKLLRHESATVIDRVEYGAGLVGDLVRTYRLVRWGGVAAVLLLMFLTSFIIANTIRLALYAHRDEVEIMRLVGATDAFIRLPFLFEGVLEGFLGAALALTLFYGSIHMLAALAQHFSLIPGLLTGGIVGLGLPGAILIIAAGMSVGFFGSYVALRRFLNG